MSFKKNLYSLKTYIAAGLILLSGLISTEALASPELSLKVKPSLCLRYASKDQCKIEVTIIWTDSAANDYCLYSSQGSQAIKCWQRSAGEQVEEQRSISHDLVYWLSAPNSEQRIISATLSIATLVNNKRQNKRRHIWNLI